MSAYYVTRKGMGPEIDRGNDYKYRSLAGGFRGRKADPFIVKVDPLPNGKKYRQNTVDGQEFNVVMEGTLEITIDDKVIVLNEGDSIYLDGRRPHCMRALKNQPVTFINVVID